MMLYTTTDDDNLQWQQILEQAGQFSGIELASGLQQYLIKTLAEYMNDASLAERALYPEQILMILQTGKARQKQLKELGDHCLIISGLYPLLAEKRHVPISHYIDLGIISYQHLSALVNPVQQVFFGMLADEFENMVSLLYTLRQFAGSEPLSPMQAYELWRDKGNLVAYQILTGQQSAIPISMNPDRCH